MLEYVPETVYRVARHFTKAKLTIPIIYVKVGRQAGCWAQAHKARGFGPSCLWVSSFSKCILVSGGHMFPVPIPPEMELAKCRA